MPIERDLTAPARARETTRPSEAATPLLARERIPRLITEGELAERVGELARLISADYEGRYPLVVGALQGAFVFMADLVRGLTIPVECDFVGLSSYGPGTVTSGEVRLLADLRRPIQGRDVLVVEDIVDTGLSQAFLIDHLGRQRPASVRLCALLDKPAGRRVTVKIDYLGFTVPNHFVVGYGIDWDQRYRELPYVGYIPSKELEAGSAAR